MTAFLSALRFPAIFLILAAAGYAIALRLDLLVPADVAAAKRRLRDHGWMDTRPLTQRLSEDIGWLQQLSRGTSTSRQLIVAGRDESAGQWWILTVGQLNGNGGIPLVFGPVLGALLVILRVLRLSAAARKQRSLMAAETEDSLPALTILLGDQTRIDAVLALSTLSKCSENQALYQVLSTERWRLLIKPPENPRTDHAILAVVGREYEVRALRDLADTVERFTERGLNHRLVLTNLARDVYDRRLQDIKDAAVRSRELAIIPMSLMILPFLLLFGFPLVVIITGSLR